MTTQNNIPVSVLSSAQCAELETDGGESATAGCDLSLLLKAGWPNGDRGKTGKFRDDGSLSPSGSLPVYECLLHLREFAFIHESATFRRVSDDAYKSLLHSLHFFQFHTMLTFVNSSRWRRGARKQSGIHVDLLFSRDHLLRLRLRFGWIFIRCHTICNGITNLCQITRHDLLPAGSWHQNTSPQ